MNAIKNVYFASLLQTLRQQLVNVHPHEHTQSIARQQPLLIRHTTRGAAGGGVSYAVQHVTVCRWFCFLYFSMETISAIPQSKF
jgi:hypothetical protein